MTATLGPGPGPALLRHRLLSPGLVAFGEAAASAACNFAISIVAARSFDADHFAGYITALSAAFVAIAFLRVVFITPSIVRADSWYRRRLPRLAAIHFIAIVAVATFITAILAGFALLLQSPLWLAAAVAAPGVSLWFMGTEFERGMVIKLRRLHALPLATLFQLAVLAILLPATLTHHVSFPLFIASLGLIGVLRSLILFGANIRPDWRGSLPHIKLGLKQLGPGGLAFLAGSVACSHAPVFALSLFSTPAAAAAFGAMRSLYQPMQIFFRSRDVVNQSRFHNERGSSGEPIAKQLRAALTRTAGLSLLLALLLAAVGPWFVHFAYGGKFDGHLPTYWMWGVIMIFINLAALTDAYISYSKLQDRYSVVQLAAGGTTIALSLLLAGRFADVGAAVSAVAGWIVIVLGGYLVINRATGNTRSLTKGK